MLTDFEVLEMLRARGAKSDPMSCIGLVAISECKVPNQPFSLLFNLVSDDLFLSMTVLFEFYSANRLNRINILVAHIRSGV